MSATTANNDDDGEVTNVTPIQPNVLSLGTVVQKVHEMRSYMRSKLIERDTEIDLVTLSPIAKQHGIFLGTGGVAKSKTIDTMMDCMDLPAERKQKAMLRKSMPVEEIIGPLSLPGLENEQYRYVTKGRLPEVYIAFLDEIFKANAVLLNALLMAINERLFVNDGVPIEIPLWSVFGASNESPNEPELAAFRDRFAWAKVVEPVKSDDGFKAVLLGSIQDMAKPIKPPVKITYDEMLLMQQTAEQVDVSGVLDTVATMKRRAEGEFGLIISARRYVAALRLCQAQAVLNGRTNVIEDDLTLFQHTLWTDPEDSPKAYEVTLDYAGKVARVTSQLRTAFEPVHNELATLQGQYDPSNFTQEFAGKVAQVQMQLKSVSTQVQKQIDEAKSDQRDTSELDSLFADIMRDRDYIRTEILN